MRVYRKNGKKGGASVEKGEKLLITNEKWNACLIYCLSYLQSRAVATLDMLLSSIIISLLHIGAKSHGGDKTDTFLEQCQSIVAKCDPPITFLTSWDLLRDTHKLCFHAPPPGLSRSGFAKSWTSSFDWRWKQCTAWSRRQSCAR